MSSTKDNDTEMLVDGLELGQISTFTDTPTVTPSDLPALPDGDRLIDEYDLGERDVMRIRQGNLILRKMRAHELKIEKKLKLEAMGAERIPQNKRVAPPIYNMVFFWFTFLMSPAFVPTGIMGPIQGLSVNLSIGITFIAVCFGSLFPAFTSTLSAATGLRQIAVSRFAFGIWGSKLCCVFNIVSSAAFGIVYTVLAGQFLRAVSGSTMSVLVGSMMTFGIAFNFSIFGFPALRNWLQYAWIPISILLIVQYGQSAKYFSPFPSDFISPIPDSPPLSGVNRTAAGLNYFALVFGQSAAWSAIIGDYYVHFPSYTGKWFTFSLTYVGLVIPSLLVTIFGNLCGGVILSNQELAGLFQEEGTAALMLAMLSPTGWAGFVGVFYCFSFVGIISMLIYSGGLSFHLLGKHVNALPRYFWTVIMGDIIVVVVWPGKEGIMQLLQTALPLIQYWGISFASILALEVLIIRPRIGGFGIAGWQDRRRTPFGLAGFSTLALSFGINYVGISNYFIVGPVAKAIGTQGGDVGLFFTMATTFILYPVLRSLEVTLTGR